MTGLIVTIELTLRRTLVLPVILLSMQKFELVIKNEKEKSYKLIGWFIIICNIAGLSYFSATTGFKKWGYLAIAAAVVLYLLFNRFIKPRKGLHDFLPPFVMIILVWSFSPLWWVALLNCVFLALDSIARRQLIVYINAEKLIYPSWPKKEISWQDLNNIVLKDRLLTIDLKNDKLYQHEVVNGENDYDVDEKEINEFCTEQLKKSEAFKYN